MHRKDAKMRGLRDGQPVRVISRRGEVVAAVDRGAQPRPLLQRRALIDVAEQPVTAGGGIHPGAHGGALAPVLGQRDRPRAVEPLAQLLDLVLVADAVAAALRERDTTD